MPLLDESCYAHLFISCFIPCFVTRRNIDIGKKKISSWVSNPTPIAWSSVASACSPLWISYSNLKVTETGKLFGDTVLSWEINKLYWLDGQLICVSVRALWASWHLKASASAVFEDSRFLSSKTAEAEDFELLKVSHFATSSLGGVDSHLLFAISYHFPEIIQTGLTSEQTFSSFLLFRLDLAICTLLMILFPFCQPHVTKIFDGWESILVLSTHQDFVK